EGRQAQDQSRQGQRQGEGLEVAIRAPLNFRYDRPSSFPDWLLTIPFPSAVNYVISNTPVNIILAAQYRNYVHRSPGVNLPQNIEHQLSVGMRYLMHSPRNSQLIKDAWYDFEERLKWRIF